MRDITKGEDVLAWEKYNVYHFRRQNAIVAISLPH
jgi:hypothetical protein